MILILLLILNNSSVGHTRAELESKPTAIPCQNHAILSVDYKLSIILGRRRPEQWRGWDGKVFTNKARWKYAYCIEGRQVEYKCGLLTQYLSMNFATWWCSTTLYNVLNDAFQALIAFIVPISLNIDRWPPAARQICSDEVPTLAQRSASIIYTITGTYASINNNNNIAVCQYAVCSLYC